MRKRGKSKWGAAIVTAFNGGGIKFTSVNVPGQCPLVLLVMVGSVKVRLLETEKVHR
jgi:hypothetical protein